MQGFLDGYRGCMIGLAVGDALGFPVEFISAAEMKRRYGPAGVTDFIARHFPPGFVSDDTQMSVALAEALVEAGGQDLETLMAAVARQFVSWSRSPQNNRAPGNTCMTACGRLGAGAHWRDAGRNDSKGCGTAMRAAPVALRYHGDTAQVIRIAEAQSLCTHGHPCATGGSVAAALAVELALGGIPPADWRDPLVAAAREYDPVCAAKLAQAFTLEGRDTARDLEMIGEGWVAEEAVAAALTCVLRHPDDFAATVLLAANTDGDSDSIACIAGSMSGALNGIQAIPTPWRDGVEGSAMLLRLAESLHEAWRGDESLD